jgi:alkylation response protein AidB-like acyl-CoA dehydrogenase
LREGGFLNLLVPRSLGGAEAGVVAAGLVVAALAEECPSTALVYAAHLAALEPICAAGEQFDRARPLLRGQKLLAFAVAEAGDGATLWHVDAHVDGGTVDCRKAAAPAAGHADFYLLAAREDAYPEATEFGLLLVEGERAGVEALPAQDASGLRGAAVRPLSFARVQLSSADAVSGWEAGYSILLAYAWPVWLTGLAACSVGVARSAAEAARRVLIGRLGDEGAQRELAALHWKVEQAEAILAAVARTADNGRILFDELHDAGLLDEVLRENPDDPFFVGLAGLRIAAAEAAVQVAERAVQACGEDAADGRLDRCLRDARALHALAPSPDGLAATIGAQLLGGLRRWA